MITIAPAVINKEMQTDHQPFRILTQHVFSFFVICQVQNPQSRKLMRLKFRKICGWEFLSEYLVESIQMQDVVP